FIIPCTPLSPFRLVFNAPPPPEIYTLSLHDALPISASREHESHRALRKAPDRRRSVRLRRKWRRARLCAYRIFDGGQSTCCRLQDRKSTRLNSSHSQISYAVFCLKKKKIYNRRNSVV